MVVSLPIACLAVILFSSHIFSLQVVTGQSSDWVVLEDISAPLESFQAAGLSDPIQNATAHGDTACNETKHEEYCNCPIRIHLDPDEYIIVNGTAQVEMYNRTYNSSFYEMEGDYLKICMPDFFHQNPEEEAKQLVGKYSTTLMYITLIGLGISMVCLVLHLIAFVLVPDLRNIPGYCMASLCASLLCGYISFLVGFDEHIIDSGGPCIAAAVSTHFFFLSSLLWMNVMAYDVLKSLLNATGKLRLKSRKFGFKNFYLYCMYSWGIALLAAIAALVSDKAPGFPEEYKPYFGHDVCWFRQKKGLLVFFAAPVFAVICMNVIFFVISAYTIICNRMKTDDPDGVLLKRNLVMYVRLAVIMGLSWVAGLLAATIDAVFLWYIFAIFNTLQGLFIFLAFTCTQKVKKHFPRRKFSGQTVSPTFRSYYTNGKSFENVTVVRHY